MQEKLHRLLLLAPITGALACGQAIEGDLEVSNGPGVSSKLEPPAAPEMPPEGVPTEPLIIGSVNWQEVTELSDSSNERQNSRSVAYLSIPSRGSRCTAFLVAPDIVMTNNHCIPNSSSARSATAYFRREAGQPSSQWAPFDCSTFLGTSSSLDYTLLRCSGRPGDTFGVVSLLERTVRNSEDIYVLHQNCDYFFNQGCNPLKKYSPGRITRVFSSSVRHDADTLGGSSGGALFSATEHGVLAIHNSGIGNNGQGRGRENGAVPMSRIVPSIRANFPNITLGGGVTPPPPPPPPTGDGFEPNNTAGQATDATAGLASSGLSIGASDIDVFRVDLPAGGDIQVNLSFVHAQGDIDVTLHPGSLSASAVANADSASNNETMTATGLAGGSYYVRVYGYNGATNNYGIQVTVTGAAPPPPPTDLEPNDSRAQAASVALPFAQSGLSIDAGDEDWYEITSTGASVSFRIDFSHAAGDLDIYLFDANGTQVDRSISTNNQELIQRTLPAGRYTLRVLGYRGATGAYDLSIQ